jgi:AcrR family transcriptional regulator
MTDGRSRRWDQHREDRLADLVEAAVTAIDRHGINAGIDDIARVAGVSKPVLYRYFADKADLHAAVGRWGADQVLSRVVPALVADVPMRQRVADAVMAYFTVIEEHPQVFLLLVQHRVAEDADPIADGKAAAAKALAETMNAAMTARGIDPAGAEPWAQGIVGLALSIGEWWLERRTMTREDVARYMTDFVWGALVGISRAYGVRLPR